MTKWQVSDILDDGHNGIVTYDDRIVIGAQSSLTQAQAEKIVRMHNENECNNNNKGEQTMGTEIDFMVGNSYLFRTVTYHWVGKVKRIINSSILELETASWVADSGRFGEAIAKGTLSETEYVGQAYVNTTSMSDFTPWKHALPTETK